MFGKPTKRQLEREARRESEEIYRQLTDPEGKEERKHNLAIALAIIGIGIIVFGFSAWRIWSQYSWIVTGSKNNTSEPVFRSEFEITPETFDDFFAAEQYLRSGMPEEAMAEKYEDTDGQWKYLLSGTDEKGVYKEVGIAEVKFSDSELRLIPMHRRDEKGITAAENVFDAYAVFTQTAYPETPGYANGTYSIQPEDPFRYKNEEYWYAGFYEGDTRKGDLILIRP